MEKLSITLGLLKPGECGHCPSVPAYSATPAESLSSVWRGGFTGRKALINPAEGIWEKTVSNAGLVLGQEDTRGLREITFIGHILYFRQLTQPSLYIWRASAEKGVAGSLCGFRDHS